MDESSFKSFQSLHLTPSTRAWIIKPNDNSDVIRNMQKLLTIRFYIEKYHIGFSNTQITHLELIRLYLKENPNKTGLAFGIDEIRGRTESNSIGYQQFELNEHAVWISFADSVYGGYIGAAYTVEQAKLLFEIIKMSIGFTDVFNKKSKISSWNKPTYIFPIDIRI